MAARGGEDTGMSAAGVLIGGLVLCFALTVWWMSR